MTRCCAPAAMIAAVVLTLAVPSPALAGQAPGENPPKTSEKISEKTPVSSDAPKRQGYSVVLLLGDMKGPDAIDSVPHSARKALADLKDFLPYKNYRLLDSQWALCCSAATPAITRLRGPDDAEYELELRSSPTVMASNGEPAPLSVRFILRELWDMPLPSSNKTELHPLHPDRIREQQSKQAIASATEERSLRLKQEIFALERDHAALNTRIRQAQDTEPLRAEQNLVSRRLEALKAELNGLPQSKGSAGKIAMDASFRMSVGETVVVGTSGLRGGSRALIALLTAVAPRK